MTASSGYVDLMVPAAESKLSSLSDDPGVINITGEIEEKTLVTITSVYILNDSKI